MKLIKLSDIVVADNRARQEFDPEYINELRESIENEGLFNAIVLRYQAEAGEELFFLVQGECRLRAIMDLHELGGVLKYDGETIPAGMVPYATLGDLDPLSAEVAEIHENTKRRDFTWQESAKATARLMEIRSIQAGEKGIPAPRPADIARELKSIPDSVPDGKLGKHQDRARQEIIVAKHLHVPEVAAAKNVKEAFKVLQRNESRARDAARGEEVGKTFTAESHTILHADSIEWLKTAETGKYSVIITDPPFGMGADEFSDADGRAAGAHRYADDVETFVSCINPLAENSVRITAPQAHLYIFCDIDGFFYIRERFELWGWWCHRTPLVWHKTNGSRVPWPQNGPQRKYELIFYAVKGKRPVTGIYPDVLSHPTEENLGHSAQKPVPLYVDLLRRTVRPGDHALDPFAGTGTLVSAAHQLKCYATVVEKDAASYGICVKRAEALKVNANIELSLEESLK